MTALEWKKKGKYVTVLHHNIFTIDQGNSKEVLLILHGYPTSSFDYYKVIDQLSNSYRVIIHDHLGFGFSDKPYDASYSLKHQADRALSLWKKLNIKEATLLAHDYGTSVATEIIARANNSEIDLKIKKLILCNGSIHIEFSKLRTIQKLLRNRWTGPFVAKLTNYRIFRNNMRNVYHNPSKVLDSELEEMWGILNFNSGKKVIHQLTQYITERYTYWDRWVGAIQATEIATTIIWAENDPIAIPKIGETLASEIPNNSIKWIENTGHFLMLENPDQWVKAVLEA